MIKNIKLCPDGYDLNATDGYSFTSNWIDLNTMSIVNISVIFTGGNPQGSITVMQSNDPPDSQIPDYPKSAGSKKGTALDGIAIPQGTTTVNGANIYVINLANTFASMRWLQVVFTASSNVVTKIDMRMMAKTLNG
jgi:hypothetical protein